MIAQPSRCSDPEIAAFCEMVRQGGEVEVNDLEARVRRARALVFLHVDRELVAVGGLKLPTKTYRDGVFRKAGVPDGASMADQELGWVFVLPAHQGKGYSRVVSAAVMSQALRKPTFATTRLDNVPMQRTLEHLAFRRLGDSWRSDRGKRPRLVLYVSS